MNLTRILTRSSLALAVAALAACQTAPVKQDNASGQQPADTGMASTTPSTTAGQPPAQPASEQGAPVAVFLADMKTQEGWRAVPVGSGSTLYLDPKPIVTRGDLTGVQAGSNQQGQGLLALMLSDDAKTRVQELTTRNPNKRLALVVGRTLMAAPSYAQPVTTGQLIFPVGTEENATAAARAIAGVNGDAGAGAPTSGMSPGSSSSGIPSSGTPSSSPGMTR